MIFYIYLINRLRLFYVPQIITDGWKAYASLPDNGYEWDKVDHNKHFVKPGDPSVHTNTIEGIVTL